METSREKTDKKTIHVLVLSRRIFLGGIYLAEYRSSGEEARTVDQQLTFGHTYQSINQSIQQPGNRTFYQSFDL